MHIRALGLTAKNSLTPTIRTGSVSTNNPKLDGHLASNDFFNSTAFPESRFVSSSVIRTGPTKALPFSLTIRDGVAHAAGSVPLSRLTFGIGQGNWAAIDIIADAVTVAFDITARQRPIP